MAYRVPPAVKAKLFNLKGAIGSAGLHTLFPNEFEYYTISLELLDSDKNTVEFFVFPITPQSLSISKSHTKTIKKTQNGISTHKSPTFTPLPINLSGNFGRTFKILLAQDGDKEGRTTLTKAFTSFSDLPNEFSSTIKTGYGCLKILERIFERSKELDSKGKTHTLIFYNPVFGQSYVVEPRSLNIGTNSGSFNRIHSYSLSLVAVAPVEQSIENVGRIVSADLVNKYSTAVASGLRNYSRQDLNLDVRFTNPLDIEI
jgi:hypothetical protein